MKIKNVVQRNWQKEKIKKSSFHQNLSFSSGINNKNVTSRKEKWIELADGTSATEFMSCSYLGLETDNRLKNAALSAIDQYGVQLAVARTRIKPIICEELEENLQTIFQGPTVTFSTVGLTHLAIFPLLGAGVLPSYPVSVNGPLWIMDKTSHASIQILRGIMQQNGEVIRVSFSDHQALADAFQYAHKSQRTPISISDGVGSMGGDAPVRLLVELSYKYNGYAYIDDAHGTSIMGKYGGGYVIHELNDTLDPRVILVSSLSKAFGATGGCVTVRSPNDKDTIQRFGTPYIFGGPVSLPGIAAALASSEIHIQDEIYTLQNKLQENIKHFDTLAGNKTINFKKRIPIRGLVVGDEVKCLSVSKQMWERGFGTTAAMYPTVQKGEAMLRVALSVLHTKKQIENLIYTFQHARQGLHIVTDTLKGSSNVHV
jgi:7-keto-8-aminopelargonate synthetase-like enzyme